MTPEILRAVAVLGPLLLINAIGVLMVLFQLPGTWVILGASGLAAWLLWDQGTFGWWTLGLLLILAVVGEVIETAGGAIGSRQAGGSRRGAFLSIALAIAGAAVGGSVGGTVALPFWWAVPGWLLAVLLGAAVGAALGAVVGDRIAGRRWKEAGRAGVGAAMAASAARWARSTLPQPCG